MDKEHGLEDVASRLETDLWTIGSYYTFVSRRLIVALFGFHAKGINTIEELTNLKCLGNSLVII